MKTKKFLALILLGVLLAIVLTAVIVRDPASPGMTGAARAEAEWNPNLLICVRSVAASPFPPQSRPKYGVCLPVVMANDAAGYSGAAEYSGYIRR